MISRLFLAAFIALLTGCISTPTKTNTPATVEQGSKGRSTLAAGIDEYVAGNYAAATKSLNTALDQGLDTKEQVKAHKYLAFIDCISGKTLACRDHFSKALDIEPTMELEPAEAGHPTWGPVFKNLKAKRATAKK
jgi:Tfp pilus assembly protein PilF